MKYSSWWRAICLALVFGFVLSVIPWTAFAQDANPTPTPNIEPGSINSVLNAAYVVLLSAAPNQLDHPEVGMTSENELSWHMGYQGIQVREGRLEGPETNLSIIPVPTLPKYGLDHVLELTPYFPDSNSAVASGKPGNLVQVHINDVPPGIEDANEFDAFVNTVNEMRGREFPVPAHLPFHKEGPNALSNVLFPFEMGAANGEVVRLINTLVTIEYDLLGQPFIHAWVVIEHCYPSGQKPAGGGCLPGWNSSWMGYNLIEVAHWRQLETAEANVFESRVAQLYKLRVQQEKDNLFPPNEDESQLGPEDLSARWNIRMHSWDPTNYVGFFAFGKAADESLGLAMGIVFVVVFPNCQKQKDSLWNGELREWWRCDASIPG